MKIPVAVAELVSEFTGLYRTPDFKPVTSTSVPCRRCPETGECLGHSRPASGASTPTRKDSMERKPEQHNRERRHSTIIAVGVDELPVLAMTPRDGSQSPEASRYAKGCQGRRQSAPCISSIATSSTLKDKLRKIKRTNSIGSDNEDIKEEEEEEFQFDGRKESVTSYRLVR